MTVILILIALWALGAIAQWQGWVADTRDGTQWLPADDAQANQARNRRIARINSALQVIQAKLTTRN